MWTDLLDSLMEGAAGSRPYLLLPDWIKNEVSIDSRGSKAGLEFVPGSKANV